MAALEVSVISLVRSIARRANVSRQLGDLGIALEFFPAIEREEGIKQFEAVCSRSFLMHTGRVPTLGEVACFASHRGIWQHCADSGRPTLILEDDFSAKPDLAEALATAVTCVEQFGLVRLQEERRATAVLARRIGRYALWRFQKPPQGAMAYVINPEVARKLLHHSRVARAPVGRLSQTVLDSRCCALRIAPLRDSRKRAVFAKYDRHPGIGTENTWPTIPTLATSVLVGCSEKEIQPRLREESLRKHDHLA